MIDDKFSSFIGGFFFVITFTTLDKVFEVFVFGLIGGISGLLGKRVVEHVWKRGNLWLQEAKLLDRRSMEYQRFWKNTVILALLWLSISAVIVLLVLLIKREIE